MAIGIMGGSFNPIHYGHLFAAEEARVSFGMRKVVFVPTGYPYYKEVCDIAPKEDRYVMVIIATVDNDRFEVSRIEIDKEGPTYSIDTVAEIKRQYPGEDVFFITGLDAVEELPTWKEPDRLLSLCRFIAVTRPGYDAHRLQEKLPHSYLERIELLFIPGLTISSTDIRRRVKNGRSIRYMVPPLVESYIFKKGLYL